MEAIEAFILDGRVTLLALSILAAECFLIAVLRRRTSSPALLANVLSGMFLIMALRAALLGSDARAVAAWLALGFAAHLADLAYRLRR